MPTKSPELYCGRCFAVFHSLKYNVFLSINALYQELYYSLTHYVFDYIIILLQSKTTKTTMIKDRVFYLHETCGMSFSIARHS